MAWQALKHFVATIPVIIFLMMDLRNVFRDQIQVQLMIWYFDIMPYHHLELIIV